LSENPHNGVEWRDCEYCDLPQYVNEKGFGFQKGKPITIAMIWLYAISK